MEKGSTTTPPSSFRERIERLLEEKARGRSVKEIVRNYFSNRPDVENKNFEREREVEVQVQPAATELEVRTYREEEEELPEKQDKNFEREREVEVQVQPAATELEVRTSSKAITETKKHKVSLPKSQSFESFLEERLKKEEVSQYIDPISRKAISNPLSSGSGVNFDRESFYGYLENHVTYTHPVTGESFTRENVQPNHVLGKEIERLKQEYQAQMGTAIKRQGRQTQTLHYVSPVVAYAWGQSPQNVLPYRADRLHALHRHHQHGEIHAFVSL